MQPKAPDPNYDFILNGGQKAKGGSWLPLGGLPRPAKIALAAVTGLMVLLVLIVLLSGGNSSSSQGVPALAARAQEIARVCNVAKAQTNDTTVQALASTVAAAMSSQETQLNAYWKANNHKVDPKALAVDQNKTIDSQLQSAAQNNNFNSTFYGYLTTTLKLYQTQLSQTYQATSSPALRNVLTEANASVQTILGSNFSS